MTKATRIQFPFPRRGQLPTFGMRCACCNANTNRFKTTHPGLYDVSITHYAAEVPVPVCRECSPHALRGISLTNIQLGCAVMGALLLFIAFLTGFPGTANSFVIGTFWVGVALIAGAAIWYAILRRGEARLRAQPEHHPGLAISLADEHAILETTNDVLVEEFLAKNPDAKRAG